jgi:hypothetical protein
LDVSFIVGTSYERAAPLAEKNVAVRHHVLRSLISLHNEDPIYTGLNASGFVSRRQFNGCVLITWKYCIVKWIGKKYGNFRASNGKK